MNLHRLHNTLKTGESRQNRDDFYFKLNDHTVINTIPAVHILHGQMSQKIMDDVYTYMDSVNDNSADSSLIANISGDQSYMDTGNPLLVAYRDQLMDSCMDYIKLHHVSHPGRTTQYGLQQGYDMSNKKLTVTGSWSVKMTPDGDFNPLHHHETVSRSGLATICYVKVPSSIQESAKKGLKDGCLEFSWNKQIGPEDLFYCRHDTSIVPYVGDYYIFPKWLNHIAYPYRSKALHTPLETRWSIQTNFDIEDINA